MARRISLRTTASATTALTCALLGLVAALAMPPGSARAQELVIQDLRPVRFFVGGGLTAGGDRLVTARSFGGRDYTLHGGALVQFHGGVEFRVAPAVSLALSLGYHVDAADGFNGSIWFRRVPIEAIGHVRIHPNWRIGGGVRVAVRPRLSSDGFAPFVDEDFRTSVGPVIEAEYLFNHRLGLKLRGVSERYRSRAGLPTVNGDHIGVMLNVYF